MSNTQQIETRPDPRRVEVFQGSDIVQAIANIASPIFRMFGWTWHGKKRPPNNYEILEHLAEKCALLTYNGSIDSGRIMLRKHEGSSDIEVYIHIGTIEDKQANWDENLW